MVSAAIIATTLSSFIINLLSSDVSVGKSHLLDKWKFYRFKRKNQKWIHSFCINHDGTILTQGVFYEYIKYQNPIAKIFDYILQPGKYNMGVDTFLNLQVEDTKLYFLDRDYKVSVFDENILKELYSKIYESINCYFSKSLSLKEKYSQTSIMNKINSGNEGIKEEIKESNYKINQDLKEIKKALSEKDQIVDIELVQAIYKTLSDEIWDGKLEDVYNILPLLKGKNEDVEKGIRIKLEILSNYHCLTESIIESWKNIIDEKISDDIARLIILNSIENIEDLKQLIENVKNKEIIEILEFIINKGLDQFLNTEIRQENHVNLIDYKIPENFKNEIWLIKRICMYLLYKQSVYNIAETMQSILSDDKNFIDEVLIVEKKQEQLLSDFGKKSEIQKEIFNEIVCLLKEIQWKYKVANEKIQLIYYRVLLRSLLITDIEELEKEISNCPSTIRNNPIIEAFEIQAKIDKNEIKENEIINFCIRTEQYWLLNNFLLLNSNSPKQILNILSKNIIIIENSPVLFFMYVQAIRIEKGKKESCDILEEYIEKYEKYLEYWLEYEKSEVYEKDLIDNIFQKWEKEQVKIINIRSEIRFIELLLIYKKYKEAYKVVKKMETLGLVNSELLYLKAKILLEQGQVINVLNILEKIFDDYEDDPFVIDTTIVLLLNNKREVSNKVLEAAIKIASSRLLMLVAVVYNRNMKKEEALDYITRALLKAEDSDVDVFSNYFELHVRSDNDSVRKISCVDSDTTVRMFSEDGIEKVYCIYEKRVLPTEIHHWKNAIHIYLDTAINLGLLRKKNGEKVCIDGLDYIITEIMPVEFFLFRICMDRLVEKGIIKQFSIPMMEDGNLDVENFIKIMKDYNLSDDNSPKWLDNYKDLSSIPLPFFQLQKNTRLKFIQFVIALMEDNTIIIRELLGLKEVAKKKYVLSITALVMLYKLGIKSEYLKENDVIISKATYYEILDEIEEIVKTNNKEEVSSIGVVENQLFLNISSEEEKILMMKEAFGLKKFIEELTIDEGKNDIEDERFEQLNLVDTFGICDYEAMIIARDSKRVLVTGEVTSMYLSQMEEMNISGIGIIDFLTAIKVTGDDLLNCMTQMRKYKFLITITNSSISYLLNCYSEIDDIELQECYMEKWINYLSIAEDINEEYKTIFIQILTEVFKYNHKSYMDSFNPMWKNFIFFIMKYNNMKVNVNFTEDGNVEVSTYKLAENQKTWEIIE